MRQSNPKTRKKTGLGIGTSGGSARALCYNEERVEFGAEVTFIYLWEYVCQIP